MGLEKGPGLIMEGLRRRGGADVEEGLIKVWSEGVGLKKG